MQLNVLYQFNEKYAPYAGISMVSLMENNKIMDEIDIYILGEDLGVQCQKKLIQQVQLYNRQIHFIDTEKIVEKIRQLGIPKYRGSYATNMKLFIADYLNANIDRLLYVDSDTIICGNLCPLVSINMDGKPIAMVLDSLGGSCKLTIGLAEDDYYFNGGVILFDLNKWRQNNCEEKITKHVQNVRPNYVSPDQDLLNVVLRGQIKKLDISYNLQPHHVAYTYNQYAREFGQKMYYSEEEINTALAKPKILHTFRYLGEFPWHKDSLHPHTPYFDLYMKLSLWSNYEKSPTDLDGILFKMERLLYKHLPKTAFLKIFKISHKIFMWKSNKDLVNRKLAI